MTDCDPGCGTPYIPSRVYENIVTPPNPMVPGAFSNTHDTCGCSTSTNSVNITVTERRKDDIVVMLFFALLLVFLFYKAG